MAADRTSAAQRREALSSSAADRLSAWLRNYQPLPGVPDELFDTSRRPKSDWLCFLGDFAQYPREEFESRFSVATRHIRDTGVSYRIYGEENERSWPLNPLPLILGEKEWGQIAAGVEQRANLMEALLADIYSEGKVLEDGALPAAVLTGSPDFIRPAVGIKPRGGRYLTHYAVDLARGPDGRWWVLDDRAQAPSGAGYALENRLVLSRAYPSLYNAMNVRRLASFFDDMRKGLAAAADRSDPRICLLTPGPFSETYFEQAHLARYLGFLLVEGADLVVRDGKVYVRTVAGLKRADVLLRRIDADFIDPLELNGRSQIGTAGLMGALRSGGVSILNMPGSGVVESKALLGFLPKLCRRFLGQDLLLPNVATWWCGQDRERDLVESRLDTLAIAPAFNGLGADGETGRTWAVADLSTKQREQLVARMRDRPYDFVGQEVVRLSTTPVLRDGRLEAAPFVLRVYAAATADGGLCVMPGGFCRTSERPDVRAISMGEDARTADVWVIADAPVDRVTLLASKDDVAIRRITGQLPSRAADNLFWLGRYLERAEATLRLIRSLCTSLMDSEAALHTAGETLTKLQQILIDWGALDEAHLGGTALEAARDALLGHDDFGSVAYLVRAARRAASSLRERLSADFWTLLLSLENSLATPAENLISEAEALEQIEAALRLLAALSGLTHENMNRSAGWRFLDLGRRIERGINTCRFARALAGEDSTLDDLDLLLDLADSQITYRARYLIGLALRPVRDMVMLDSFNTRSAAFQVEGIKNHLEALPPLLDDGMLEAPMRVLLPLATSLEAGQANDLDEDKILTFEQTLMRLSDAVADRYFLQGANAVPTAKLGGLA